MTTTTYETKISGSHTGVPVKADIPLGMQKVFDLEFKHVGWTETQGPIIGKVVGVRVVLAAAAVQETSVSDHPYLTVQIGSSEWYLDTDTPCRVNTNACLSPLKVEFSCSIRAGRPGLSRDVEILLFSGIGDIFAFTDAKIYVDVES